ncbi:hypothetical protein MFIFM68171_02669 [Madurella fahalii]|uniref:Amidase domain-containing protein n=1 Tax=Madurella fahalii TaxID=1157608 RepID=A0ABQ0G428_9PEZI
MLWPFSLLWAGASPQKVHNRQAVSQASTPTSAPADTLAVEEGVVVLSLSPDSYYLIRLQSLAIGNLGNVQHGSSLPPSFVPATVIYWDTPTNLHSKIKRFRADDEFDSRFLKTIVLVAPGGDSVDVAAGVQTALLEVGCGDSIFVIQDTVPEGPYFVRDQKLYRTWRLYPDIYEAFHLPTIQEPGSTRFIGVTVMYEGKLMVPVPSRLHYPQTEEKPLNGLRITVKEIVDLAGVKTTGQSRSYEKLYGPRSETAYVVSVLLKLGAVVIGKTKCTQFASSDQPTADWIDFHCPWNPRGDGYLSPRGSSTGTCVALAGYPWCDAGIGSDTGGSIRGPATVMGLFAIRPTHSAERLHGILPISPDMDTPGLVCRDTELFYQLSRHLFSHTEPLARSECEVRDMPSILLFPTDYWETWRGNPAMEIMEEAVCRLEKYLDVERTTDSLAQRWLDGNPTNSRTSIGEYLQDTFMTLLWQGYYENLSRFIEEYKKKYNNPPYVHPVIQDCFTRGKHLTPEDVAKAHKRKSDYSKWLRESVLGDSFRIIMVYPVGDLAPFYRDDYRPDPQNRSQAYHWRDREDHQASLAGLPSVIVPVGQVAQPSKVTGRDQHLPVAISLMSGAGTDTQLVGMLHDMAKEGYLVGKVNVGTHAF